MGQLGGELDLTAQQNFQNHFGKYVYARLAEAIASDKLAQTETVQPDQAMEIVREVAELISGQTDTVNACWIGT